MKLTTQEKREKRKSLIDNLDTVPQHIIEARNIDTVPQHFITEATSRLQKKELLYSKISQHIAHEKLIAKIVATIAQLEDLVLCELKILESAAFNTHLDPKEKEQRILEIKKKIKACKTLGDTRRQESFERTLSREKNPVTITREKEVQILLAIDRDPSLFEIIKRTPMKRISAAPGKPYRNQLASEIYRLLHNHAENDGQRRPGYNIDLTSEVIKTISPLLNTSDDFSIYALKNILTPK